MTNYRYRGWLLLHALAFAFLPRRLGRQRAISRTIDGMIGVRSLKDGS